MNINLQVADSVYQQLISGTARIQGSIGLVSPTEGNFNAHRRNRAPMGGHSMKLPHGKVSMDEAKVRMYLYIARTEQVEPAKTIEAESLMACDFVDFMEGMA